MSDITPPPGSFAVWLAEAKRLHPGESLGFISGEIAMLAYRSGADAELEACCQWLSREWARWPDGVRPEDKLREARRPKSPSLKQQALDVLESYASECWCEEMEADLATIRRALEQLSD